MEKRQRALGGQRQLFPISALWCGPQRLGGRDCTQVCSCDDGFKYAVKLDVPDKSVAHNEWFCSNLAYMSGLNQVTFNPIIHTDGRVWFGSQWMDGELPDGWTHIKTSADFANLTEQWTKIFVFDLFINNPDRHLKNFFVSRDGSTLKMYTLDYSRSWFFSNFPPAKLPLPQNCNTILWHRWIRQRWHPVFDLAAAESSLAEDWRSFR